MKTPDSEEDNIWNDKVIILDEIVQVQEPQTDPHLWCRALPLGLERQPSGHAKVSCRSFWILSLTECVVNAEPSRMDITGTVEY